jgi:hypothetical protein
MNHYQKLALVAIRVIGSCLTIYALVAMVYAFVNALIMSQSFGVYFLASFAYAIVGLVLFALSKPLAALIARKL